ncbi:glycosyltransferase [Methanoculleus palmolei]|jgi:glycosyltransferase involved in cell wall biosynthesis|uniref:Glycosyltransferase n=1 Tax=Methanoculleus palmolei TaxID=72612 RepID=A0ABD8A9M6_9EURY|nr:glycosyltransferase [Methanoculleus palmolei]
MISVIVPALNEEATILDCLESLVAQSIPRGTYEIIVVDGGSSDRTREYAKPVADRVISQKRAGIGGARGDGAEAANGDILVFTDADTRHPPAWLETIQEVLTVGGYDVCTGPVRFYDPTFRSCLIRGWRQYYLLLHPFGFYWLIGSNFAVKKDVYIRAGGHRDISILEDYDLSLRLFDAHAECIYDRRIVALTSARRMKSILGYAELYLTGYYHYHVTGRAEGLLKYPYSGTIALRRSALSNDLKSALKKINNAWGKVIGYG